MPTNRFTCARMGRIFLEPRDPPKELEIEKKNVISGVSTLQFFFQRKPDQLQSFPLPDATRSGTKVGLEAENLRCLCSMCVKILENSKHCEIQQRNIE